MKKLLPVLLCAAMLLCLLPLEARAAAAAWDGTVDISRYDPAQTEYTIDTPAKLAGLAALVNGMADPAAKAIVGDRSYLVSKKVDNVMLVGAGGGNVFDTVYTGGVDFAYKTIYLTADLDMGGRKAADGSWTGPNWTPIGGKFPMKPQEASGDCLTLDTRFNGVLDGQGHTIYNLYCDRCAAKGFPFLGWWLGVSRDGGIAPRKKVQSIWISTASPIDGSRSTATSYKSDTPVSGSAYQNIREVTTEWNDARNIGACLKSDAECTKRIPKRPFLPYLFPRVGKDMAVGDTSETTTTERILASKASYPLCSFLPFQTAN